MVILFGIMVPVIERFERGAVLLLDELDLKL